MNPVIAPPGSLWLHFAYKEFVLAYFDFRYEGRAPDFPDEPWMGYAHMDAVCVLMSALQAGRIKSLYLNDDGSVDLKPGFWRKGTRYKFIETGILSDREICDEDENIFVDADDFRETLKALKAGRIAEVMGASGAEVASVILSPDDNEQKIPEKTTGQPLARQRGPKPIKGERIKAAMRAMKRSELEAMKHVEMAAKFGAVPDTCEKARKAVLAEFRGD